MNKTINITILFILQIGLSSCHGQNKINESIIGCWKSFKMEFKNGEAHKGNDAHSYKLEYRKNGVLIDYSDDVNGYRSKYEIEDSFLHQGTFVFKITKLNKSELILEEQRDLADFLSLIIYFRRATSEDWCNCKEE